MTVRQRCSSQDGRVLPRPILDSDNTQPASIYIYEATSNHLICPFGASEILIKTMRPTHTVTTRLIALFAFISIAALTTPAQTNQARSLVTAPVNDSQMVMRPGSTHPLARAEFD